MGQGSIQNLSTTASSPTSHSGEFIHVLTSHTYKLRARFCRICAFFLHSYENQCECRTTNLILLFTFLLSPLCVCFAFAFFAVLWPFLSFHQRHSLFHSTRVENKIFYGHKIVLVTASPRLQSLLSTKVNEGNGTPTVQINDIRYHIFEVSVYMELERCVSEI